MKFQHCTNALTIKSFYIICPYNIVTNNVLLQKYTSKKKTGMSKYYRLCSRGRRDGFDDGLDNSDLRTGLRWPAADLLRCRCGHCFMLA